MSNKFELFRQMMLSEGIDEKVVASFKYLYDKLAAGEKGKLTSTEIDKPGDDRIINYADLSKNGVAPWEQLVILKLNGGLGTSMGLDKAKSLLKVKDDYTFLDIIANQIIHQRQQKNINIPLLFMNSFNTSADTLSYLDKYRSLNIEGIPLDFLQNKFPKVNKESLEPLNNKDNKNNWNPPGHGEIYMVLKHTGLLDLLLDKGYKYIFISNSDNLGAIADEKILQYLANNDVPFIMEVCHRTEMDKKGGHLARDKNGRLKLRETAQCPDNEIEQFQDINYFQYFNTNNIWLNLAALSDKLAENNNFIQLTPIMNHKTEGGVNFVQLETAMGAAINVFENSQAIAINRERFAPVKTTNEFLAVRSDAYVLDDNWMIGLREGKDKAPQIKLDDRYYKTIQDFEQRFKQGYPSLQNCEGLTVTGDVHFGKNVTISGKVIIISKGKSFLENANLIDEIKNL